MQRVYADARTAPPEPAIRYSLGTRSLDTCCGPKTEEKKPMCDEHYLDDLKKYMKRSNVTRREFGVLSAGVGVTMLLPPVANAQDVTEQDVEIETPDGTADAYFVHPSTGAH